MSLQDTQPKKENISLLGLLISRKTDIIAIVALLLSIATIFGNFFLYIQNSIIDIFLPEQIQLIFDDCDNKTFHYVGVIAPVTFLNRGKYDDVSMSEKLFVSVEDRTMQLYPYQMVKTTRNYKNKDYCDDRKPGEFYATDIEQLEIPMHTAVKSGSVVSRQVLYIADSLKCNSDLDSCVTHPKEQYVDYEHLKEGGAIDIGLHVKFLDDGIKKKSCRVSLNKLAYQVLGSYFTVTSNCISQ